MNATPEIAAQVGAEAVPRGGGVTRNVDLPAWYTEAHGEREAVAKEQARML